MTPYEISDLIASQLSLINETWNFFLTIHLGILGLLIITRHYVSSPVKLVIVLAYVGFAFVNYSAQADSYGRLAAFYEDARAVAQAGGFAGADGATMRSGEDLAGYDLASKARFLPLVYAVTGVLTLLCLMFVNTLQDRRPGE